MQPLLLCVHMDQARLMRISFAALSLGITVKEVKESERGQSLAALCGLEPPRKNVSPVPVTDEMMIFAHFSNALLDRFLLEMKEARIEPVRLKAVLTPHNQSWSCGQLCAALSQEALYMEQNRKGKQE